MRSLVYKDQSAGELCLTVVNGRIDVSQFHVLEEGTLGVGGSGITGRIIGASHCISFYMGDLMLSEVLACQQVEAEDIASRKPVVRSGECVDIEMGDGVRYGFAAEVVDDVRAFDRLGQIESLAHTPGCVYLDVRFPETPEGATPRTIIVLTAQMGDFRAETAHVYPNEGIVVFTSSKLVAPRTELVTGGRCK